MTVRVACVQSDVAFNAPSTNAANALAHLKRLKDEGVDLAVFPEAFLTGYVVNDENNAKGIALHLENDKQLRVTNASEPINRIKEACQDLKMHAVVGAIVTDGVDVYNAAVLFEPDGTMRRYFKTHLPYLGVDRFVVPGWDLPVFKTEIGNIGINICYDMRVPESIRVLALQGADIIVLPTNWPVGAELSADHFTITRSVENRVFFVACNRVGTENGTTFIGRSGIYDVVGKTLAKAGDGEEVITAEFEPELARQKRTVLRPGEYELDITGSRRPALYERLTK